MSKQNTGSVEESSDSLKVKNPTSLYAKSPTVYVKKGSGRFSNLRLMAAWALLAIYYGLPWLTWNGNQAVLLDLPARKFHFFEITPINQNQK